RRPRCPGLLGRQIATGRQRAKNGGPSANVLDLHRQRRYRRRPDGRSSVLGALAALAEQAAALLLGGAAPDAVALAVGEGVLEARLTHRANGTDALRLPGIIVRSGVEDRRVQTAAGPLLTPRQVHDCVLPS